jgi:hypothetical protein
MNITTILLSCTIKSDDPLPISTLQGPTRAHLSILREELLFAGGSWGAWWCNTFSLVLQNEDEETEETAG